MNFGRALLERAAATPAAPALESIAGVQSFGELALRAKRGAAFVRSRGPVPRAPVALLAEGDARFVAWFLAVSLAGRPVLPLNVRLTAVELARQLRDAGVSLLLADAADPRLGEIERECPGTAVVALPELESLADDAGPFAGEAVPEDAVQAVLFTSGTSGRARGACLTGANFAASARGAAERLGDCVAGRWLACMPLFHVGGLSIVARSLLFGGPVRLHSRFEVAAVSGELDRGDVAGMSLVPTMLSRLLAHRGERSCPTSLRALLLGGAAAPPSLVSRALALGYPVCPTYGLTEATSQVATTAPPRRGDRGPGPMLPLAGTELRIVADGLELPPGGEGEVLVRGPTVMAGYLGDPVATARTLRDGWLHTGDVGFLDARGALTVLDRRDDLVVSGGENVYPAEVEAALLEHPAVVEAGVCGLPDEDLGSRVAAWVVLAPGAPRDPDDLARHCAVRLAGFKRPREYRFVDALPRNAAGKLLRRRLAEHTGGD